MFQPAQILDNRYKIKGEIARGGMGVIYRAEDLQLKDDVAIKLSISNASQFLEAFESEARILTSLRHSGLPQVRGYFSENNYQILVMEFIEGENLLNLLEKREEAENPALPLAQVDKIVEQLTGILEYLHGKGVIHRDIKPENIKLTPNGKLILLDFGLAKDNAKSMHGATLNYAAPEQISNQGTSNLSDIYSFGATLYHLLSGKEPTSAIIRLSDSHSSNSDTLRPVHLINPLVPKEVSDLIVWTMQLNPESRPKGIELFYQNWRTVMKNPVSNNFQSNSSQQTSIPTLFLNSDSVNGLNLQLPPETEKFQSFEPNISNPSYKHSSEEIIQPTEHIINIPFNNEPAQTESRIEDIFTVKETRKKKPILLFAAIVAVLLFLLGSGIFAAWMAGVFKDRKSPIIANKATNNSNDTVANVNTNINTVANNNVVNNNTNANNQLPPSTSELKNGLNLSLFQKKDNQDVPVRSNFIFHSGDEMYFVIKPLQDSFLYVVVYDSVERKLILFYPSKRFPTSREILKGEKELRYPPVKEIKFGKVDTKDRDYNADKFYFILAPTIEDDLIKEIETTISEEKPLSIDDPKAKTLLEKLDRLAETTKTNENGGTSFGLSTNYTNLEKSFVALLELRSAGK